MQPYFGEIQTCWVIIICATFTCSITTLNQLSMLVSGVSVVLILNSVTWQKKSLDLKTPRQTKILHVILHLNSF